MEKILLLRRYYHLNINRVLKKAKESGYFIKCVFMLTVDPEVNVAR